MGLYSVAQGYKSIKSTPSTLPNPAPWNDICKHKSISKVDLFIWTLAHQCILTSENLQKRGIIGPCRCDLYLQYIETYKHMFLNYQYTREVWQDVLSHVGVIVVIPSTISALLSS